MPQARSRQRSRRLLRHRIHMYAYATVSFALIVMGLVFSGFAIFEQKSEISKIWLAGPTTIAVGLVLCGKVIIDCRPRGSSDDEEAYGNDAEIIDVLPEVPEREKAIVVNSESNHMQNLAKDGSLIIQNMAVDKKDALKSNNEMCKICALENDVWNLRDDCSSTGTPYEICIHCQHDNSMCLHNPSARDSSILTDANVHYCHLNSATNSSNTRPSSCHYQTMQTCSPCSTDRRDLCSAMTLTTPSSRHSRCVDEEEQLELPSSLYQGETFLLNDKQYFI